MAPSASRTKLVESMLAKSWSVWWESELSPWTGCGSKKTQHRSTLAIFYSSEPSNLGSNTTWATTSLCREADKPRLTAEMKRVRVIFFDTWHCVTVFVASRITSPSLAVPFRTCPKLGLKRIHRNPSGMWRAIGTSNVHPSLADQQGSSFAPSCSIKVCNWCWWGI